MRRERFAALESRAREVASQAEAWFARIREERPLIDFTADTFDLDQEAEGSVLGSAVALRLFLFVIPATVVLVALINLINLGNVLDSHLTGSIVTGEIARTVSTASWWSSLWIVLTGLVLTLWAGRSLARVLGACSGAAWRLPPRKRKVSPLSVVALTAILFTTVAASSISSGLRDRGVITAALIAWPSIIGLMGLSWFLIMMTLPRGTSDPGALLPGAAVFGIAYAGLAWFMELYLPNRVSRTTDTLGAMAITVATLGYFFFIGRMMTAALVLSASTFERFGSLSRLVFGWPLLRRIPRRYAKFRRFFDIPIEGGPTDDTPIEDGPIDDAPAPSPEDAADRPEPGEPPLS